MHKLIITLLLLVLSNVASAAVKAFLNQDTFYEGDPVTLTIESSGTDINNNAKPDLRPLNRDFQILGTSTSMQVNIHNGHKRSKKSWTVELQPQRKGSIQIPSIHIGHESTSPVNLTIKAIPPALAKETSKHIFIESSVDITGKQPYVQQQIPYTVKLYYDANMQNGKIYSPTVENAVVEQLGEDRRYRTVRMGKKYSVVEKHFVISPEKSGTLHIPPTSVKGRLTVSDNNANNPKNGNQNGQRRNGMGNTDFMNRFFNRSPFGNDPFFKDFGNDIFSGGRPASKPFTASSEAITVEVQPIPDSFTGKLWLPAEDLIIEDSWANSPPELRVGEPVTRILRLQAKGLAGSQIPKIEIPKPDNIRIYPEQAKSDTQTDGKTVYGISEISISYIPDVQGKVSVPEIKLDWWNVVTKKQQTFTLPKWDLTVAPGVTGSVASKANAIPVPTPKTIEDTNSSDNSTNPNTSPQNTSTDSATNNIFGWLLAAVVLLLAGALAYFYMIRRKQTLVPAKPLHPNNNIDNIDNISEIKAGLQQACTTNNPEQAAEYLLRFVNAGWGGNNPPQNLGSLAEVVTQGKEAILDLQRSLYSKNNSQWNGSHLWEDVKDGIQTTTVPEKNNKQQLKPLYPTL